MKKTLNPSEQAHATIRWAGKDTQGMHTWIAYGKSYKDIWDATVQSDVNHYEDWENYILNKLGRSQDEFWDEDGICFDSDSYDNLICSYSMDDDEYRDLIDSCKGNAYYSTFEYAYELKVVYNNCEEDDYYSRLTGEYWFSESDNVYDVLEEMKECDPDTFCELDADGREYYVERVNAI